MQMITCALYKEREMVCRDKSSRRGSNVGKLGENHENTYLVLLFLETDGAYQAISARDSSCVG